MEVIKCVKINEHHNSASFYIDEKTENKNFDKVLKYCEKCKYYDNETDFPNSFCDKNCEGIDYHFCSLKCPLGKFEIKE